MVPGMGTAIEERLRQLLCPAVSSVSEESLAGVPVSLLAAGEEQARALGISAEGPGELTVVLTDPGVPIGQVRVQTSGRNNTLFFDNRPLAGQPWGGQFYANIRIAGSDSILMFNRIGGAYVSLPELFLRSDGQFVFWGEGASAVGGSLEVEGVGHGMIVGDDALISGGVWLRNYDMHAIHDLASGQRIGHPPVDTVLERHVWLGQDALLLNCERVGIGSIVGARSLVKGTVPERVIIAGTPARVIRREVSWGRHPYGMTGTERLAIGVSELPEA